MLSIKVFTWKHKYSISVSARQIFFFFLMLCVALYETSLCFVLLYKPQRFVIHLFSVENVSTTSFLSLLSTYFVTSLSLSHITNCLFSTVSKLWNCLIYQIKKKNSHCYFSNVEIGYNNCLLIMWIIQWLLTGVSTGFFVRQNILVFQPTCLVTTPAQLAYCFGILNMFYIYLKFKKGKHLLQYAL